MSKWLSVFFGTLYQNLAIDPEQAAKTASNILQVLFGAMLVVVPIGIVCNCDARESIYCFYALAGLASAVICFYRM